MGDLTLKHKIEEMLPYMDDRLENFPAAQRNGGLVPKIRSIGYDMLVIAEKIGNGHFNATTVRQMDDLNLCMKVYLGYALKRRYIAFQQHRVWSEKLSEIGRLIGGLQKALPANRR
ncbi:MAG: four helix bundle protein [Clostridiales bacterium]|mgnify:CR=1 FL=1|nr:four helix bundle protein [Clostridiales bacterium]